MKTKKIQYEVWSATRRHGIYSSLSSAKSVMAVLMSDKRHRSLSIVEIKK